MFELAEIGERLRTQDNRITADPIFVVQEKVRVYGIDTDYGPSIEWLYEDESIQVDPFESAVLELSYHYTRDEPEGYRRVGYHEYWATMQPFFTEAAALRYIEGNGHRHSGELRVYADSAYRNPEWQAVRKHLMEPPCPNCQGTRTVTWRHDDGDELTSRCPECTEASK